MKKIFFCLIFFYGCSPIKPSPEGETVQMELSLHETKINLDDMKHDIKCFQTDIEILEKKIQNLEKKKDFSKDLQMIEKRYENLLSEVNQICENQKILKNEYIEKINNLEKIIISQNEKFDKIDDLKRSFNQISAYLKEDYVTYKVKTGDSLEIVAKTYNTTIDEIRKVNGIKGDLIVVGQELKIPK